MSTPSPPAAVGLADAGLLFSALILVPLGMVITGALMLIFRRHVRRGWGALVDRTRLPDSVLLADTVALLWQVQALVLLGLGTPALGFNLWFVLEFAQGVSAPTGG